LRFILAALVAAVVWSVIGGLLAKVQVLRPAPEDVRRLLLFFPRSSGDRVLWILLSISAGVCEEMVYRGYLFRQFLAATKLPSVSLVGQALLYSSAHAALPWQVVVVVALLGLLFGVLSYTQKSLIPAMLLHIAMDIVPGVLSRAAN
jgi:membrane protease YdiL (CAAX protease family)